MFDQVLRRVVPWGWVAVGLGAYYVVGVLAFRYGGTVVIPQPAPQPDLPPVYSGPDPKIAHFYAGSGVLTRGESAVVCYGVHNMRSLRLDPPVEEIKPALNRCFAVSPAKTTTYTLLAEGTDGRQLTSSFTITVNPAPPRFSMFATAPKELVRGERWAFCYSVENALSVRLEPIQMTLPTGQKRCIMLYPAQTTEYRLIATGENGMTAVEKFAVNVIPRPK